MFINVIPEKDIEEIGDGFLSPLGCNDTNRLDIFVFSRNNHVLIVSRLDNLGKEASGAAVQNMNIMIGVPENKGLKGGGVEPQMGPGTPGHGCGRIFFKSIYFSSCIAN